MKMKLSLGEGGIKGFLARHVEKIVLGLAVLVVVWVALPDSKRQPIDENLAPESIVAMVNTANQRLATEKAWPLIKGERFKTADEYAVRAEKSLIRVDRDGYPAEIPFNKPSFPMEDKRRDPHIYPVEKIEVAVSYGPVTATDSTKLKGQPIRGGGEPADDERPLPAKVIAKMAKFGASGSGGGKAEGKYIVSVMGTIPVKLQMAKFKEALEDAADYNEARDFPNYGAGKETEYGKYYYQVERAEIAPDGTEGAWKKIGDSYRARRIEAGWPSITELADGTYVDQVWTMALPPLMLRDLRPLALHSAVPSAAQRAEEAAAPEEEPEDDPMDFDGPVGDDDELEPDAGPRPPRGAPRPPMIRPRGPRGGEDGFARGEGGMVGNEEVEFKLFRYFDMDVQPGKAYVYRVKLFLEDPNDPSPEHAKPPLRVLDKSVIERLARKTDKSVWWRESEYSEVSAVVRVPATNQVLAGPVLPGKVVQPAGVPVGIRQTEETAKVMALVWDEKKAMDVPGTLDVFRGSVLNFTADVEAIDVSKSVLRKLAAYPFQTHNIVLDLRGGEALGKKSDLSTPGEMLLIDDAGNLVVRKELEDRLAFEENTFPAEPKAAAAGDSGLEGEDKRPKPSTRPRTPRPSSGEGEASLLEGGPSRPTRRERP